MITTSDILEATGLKSSKTLTRWHQRGLIPEPLVRTHPSGRGKMSYWPDWVLDRCLRIVELQRQGHSLESAAQTLKTERWNRLAEEVNSEPNFSDVLEQSRVDFGAGREGTLLDAYLYGIVRSLTNVMTNPEEKRALLEKLRERRAVDDVLGLTKAGYNPVLMYDGDKIAVIPDFLVGQRLSEPHPPAKGYFVAPVLPTLRAMFPWLDEKAKAALSAWPAPKVWVKDEGTVMEYLYHPSGPIGFQLIRETAKVVGTMPGEAGTDVNTGI